MGLAVLWVGCAPAWGESFGLIVCGSGGEVVHSRRLEAWGRRLDQVLAREMDFVDNGVVLLTEGGPGAGSTLEGIKTALQGLAGRMGAADDLFVFLIGHGNFRQRLAKFHIPGPDLSARALGRLLDGIAADRVAVVNSASSSAPFIAALSGPRRVICTSTGAAQERNATVFMEFFLTGLEGGSADLDRDGRIAVGEACRQAAALTHSWYDEQGRLATEHALLDDDGDGQGSSLAPGGEAGSDGQLADQLFLRQRSFPVGAQVELVAAYRRAMAQVEAHIAAKETDAGPDYYRRLEELLLEAARINRQLRSGAPVP